MEAIFLFIFHFLLIFNPATFLTIERERERDVCEYADINSSVDLTELDDG